MSFKNTTLLENAQIGYALHQIIYDDNNTAIDYRFLEVNDAYLTMTRFTPDIIGKTLLAVVPNIREDSTDWISLYADVANNMSKYSSDQYSEALGKWYRIYAYSPSKSYFTVLLSPITDASTGILSATEMQLNYYRNESLVRIMAYRSLNFSDFLDYALSEAITLTESDIGYIYLYDGDTETFSLNSWSSKVMDACTITQKQTEYMLKKTGFWGEVVRQKKAIINNNFAAFHPHKKGFPEGHAPLHKFMSLPIYDKGQIVAVIGLGNKATDYIDTDVIQIQNFMENVWDMAKRKQAEDELATEKETLRATLESIGDAVFSVDRLGRIITMNGVAESMTGHKRESAINKRLSDMLTLKSAVTGEHITNMADMAMLSTSYSKMNEEIILISIDGQERYVTDTNTPILDVDGTLKGAVIILRDITLEHKNSEKILFMSYHDALTGLYNRRFFEEELARLDTNRQLPLSLILGDVNGLKLTNDVFGHLEGDNLLKTASDIIRGVCRTEDIIARWGGDEFVLLLPRTSYTRAEEICKLIKTACHNNKNNVIDISIALGYATKELPDQDIGKTLKLAEDYMYRHKLTESKSQRSNIIYAIQNSLYEKSHETEEHAERLISHCHAVARQLKLSDEDMDNLKLLAVLHDIGKIGIPDHILLKPGPLNEVEWYEMRKHPEIGYRIAQSSPDLQQIAEYILMHHEKWDGTGYPHNIKGEDIPILSRILSVADAYDAMISNRPYRKALPIETAITELKDYAGSQFDPLIVSIFTKVLKETVNK
ncbi:MAG: diguanylate cyclase [Vallitaleaceae bacterium]|jgi:diguanylate cyclase (GGDEF)-like protein/PAS domain S-box-containing protein|nr:diguanylate cyclase [Vallitaleaceae bacterium]